MPYLQRLLELLDLWPVLAELKIELATFRDLQIPADLDDRSLWRLCQQDGWVLFTDNRNNLGPDFKPRWPIPGKPANSRS